MESADEMREAFEEWFRKKFHTDGSNSSLLLIARMLRCDTDNEYVDIVTRDYWEEWQAACEWQKQRLLRYES